MSRQASGQKRANNAQNVWLPVQGLEMIQRATKDVGYVVHNRILTPKKITLREVFKHYGKNLRIQIKIQTTKNKKVRTIEFLDLATLRRMEKNKTN